MIVGQAFAVVVQSVQAGAGEHAALAHGASEELADPVHPVDRVAVTDDDGADRAAESLREAGGHRVEAGGVVRGRDTARRAGVPDACSVQMAAQAVAAGGIRHRAQAFQGPHRSPAPIVGVLGHQQAGSGVVGIVMLDGGMDIVRVELPAFSIQQADRAAGDGRPRTGFVEVDVALAVGDDLITRIRMDADRGLVRHRARRYEARGFLSEQIGHAILQGDHGRLVPQYVVAEFGVDHGLFHGVGGKGDGVAAEIGVNGHASSLAAGPSGIERPPGTVPGGAHAQGMRDRDGAQAPGESLDAPAGGVKGRSHPLHPYCVRRRSDLTAGDDFGGDSPSVGAEGVFRGVGMEIRPAYRGKCNPNGSRRE